MGRNNSDVEPMDIFGLRKVELPDTFGLQEFLISDVVTEIDGPNVRMVCGIKRAGQMHWLFSCVARADQLLGMASRCQCAALEAVGLQALLIGKGH